MWLSVPRNPIVGYLNVAFFGVGVIIALVTLHPNSTYLILDKSGFTFSTMFRKAYFPWNQIQSFVVARVSLNKMVGWNFIPEYSGYQAARKINTGLCGAEAALPDTYGISAEELVEVMNTLRTRYGTAAL